MAAQTDPANTGVPSHILADTLTLIEDLTRIVDITTAGQDLPQRRHTLALANRLRQLRQHLDPAGQQPASTRPTDWYAQLVGALGDCQGLPRAAIEAHLDHIEAIVDRASQRRTKRWWWTNNR